MDWAEVGSRDVHFVCANTPQKHGEYACDMSYVDAAFETLAPHLLGPALVVGKSTVPVGSAERLARTLADALPAGEDAELAWNPEFPARGLRRPGHAAPRPSWSACAASGPKKSSARCTRRPSPRARPSSSPTSRPPSW